MFNQDRMPCRLREETMVLAEDYLTLCCRGPQPAPPPRSESAAAMRRLAHELEKQQQTHFHYYAQTFLRQYELNLCSSLKNVMEELVGDGHLNWGRVVALFAFTGVVARQLKEQIVMELGLDPGLEQDLRQGLAKTIADFLVEEKRDWLLENDGWEGFCKFSRSAQRVSHYSAMKTALFATVHVGFAGLNFLLMPSPSALLHLLNHF